MPHHIHILISAKPHISLSDLVKDLKSSSSRWINENGFVKGKFLWQEGFGAFSYSQSSLTNVIAYIENQEIHHSKKTFKQEYIETLKAFQIDYDEKYILRTQSQISLLRSFIPVQSKFIVRFDSYGAFI